MAPHIAETRVTVVPFAIGFVMSHEQFTTFTRHVLGDETMEKEKDKFRMHVPLVEHLRAKKTRHTAIPRWQDNADGSRRLSYCYVFDAYPSFNGDTPRVQANKTAMKMLWREIGAADVLSDEEISILCFEWPVAYPDWFDERLLKHLRQIQAAHQKRKRLLQQEQEAK